MMRKGRAGMAGKAGNRQKMPTDIRGKRMERKASMTVEAALVLSLVLLILMGCMRETITWYQQVAERAGISWVELEEVDRRFRLFSLGRELIE